MKLFMCCAFTCRVTWAGILVASSADGKALNVRYKVFATVKIIVCTSFCHEDRGNSILRNVGNQSHDHSLFLGRCHAEIN